MEFDNKYGVIPMIHIDSAKEVYSVMKFDGHSFPEAGVYSKKEDAEKMADILNREGDKPMNIEQAIEVLEEHNKWRTAKPPYDVCGVRSKHQPSEITEAIDTAVRAMRERVSE